MRNFKLYGFANSTWYDLSSYVDRDITIPVWTRNKNGTPTAEGFTFGLVDTITLSILQNLSRVKFSVDNTSKFLGTINKKQQVISKRIWEYEVLNAIIEMDAYNVEHAALNSIFTNSSDPYKYKPVDGNYYTKTFSNVSLPWLLECLLTKSNLPCNASALYYESSINLVRPSGDTWAAQYVRDIRFDLGMIWAVNQEVAASYITIDDESLAQSQLALEFASKKISGMKLFSILCGAFSITCRFENDAYVLERREGQTSGESYTIGQSNVYDTSQKQTVAEFQDDNFCMKATDRFWYYADHPIIQDLRVFGYDLKGKGLTITWYRNLIPLVQDHSQEVGITMIMDQGFYLNPRLELYLFSLYFKEKEWDESETNLESAIQDSFYNVDEHYINPRKERSIIKQGVYS